MPNILWDLYFHNVTKGKEEEKNVHTALSYVNEKRSYLSLLCVLIQIADGAVMPMVR